LVAVPAGQPFNTVTFVKSDGSKASKTITSTSVARNKIREMKTGTYFATATYSGCEPVFLPGVFKIDNTTSVRFTRGNVRCNAPSGSAAVWGFEGDQLDIAENGEYNSNHVSHFFCRSNYGYGKTSTAVEAGITVNWGQAFGESCSDLITLTKDQFDKIKQNHSWTIITSSNNIVALLIVPQNFTWNTTSMGMTPSWGQNTSGNNHKYTPTEIANIEAAGGLFLPAGGQRTSGSPINNSKVFGYYAYYNTVETGKILLISTGGLFNTNGGYGNTTAYSVRLAKYVQ